MLMFKMSDLKKIAVETKVKSLAATPELKIAPDALKYDRVYITNLESRKMLDNIR